jgi:hypothetical protein
MGGSLSGLFQTCSCGRIYAPVVEELRRCKVLRHDEATPWSGRPTEAFVAKVNDPAEKVKAA